MSHSSRAHRQQPPPGLSPATRDVGRLLASSKGSAQGWGVRGSVREREGDPGCGIPASCVRRRTVYGSPPESLLLTSPLPADNQATLGPKPTTYALPHTP